MAILAIPAIVALRAPGSGNAAPRLPIRWRGKSGPPAPALRRALARGTPRGSDPSVGCPGSARVSGETAARAIGSPSDPIYPLRCHAAQGRREAAFPEPDADHEQRVLIATLATLSGRLGPPRL